MFRYVKPLLITRGLSETSFLLDLPPEIKGSRDYGVMILGVFVGTFITASTQ